MTFEPKSHWQPTILYDVVVGSHLYGTNHAGSDYDTRFVFAPRIGQVLGISKLEEVWRLDNDEGQDREGKELRAWVRQLLQGNPNMLDQLFAPPECVRVTHPAIQYLLDNKQLFLGQHVRKPFCEMARAHLHWLRDDIEKKPRHGRHTPRIELIAKYGWDCYLDDTEFLTLDGWRRYDDIADDAWLAVVDPWTGAMSYEQPIDRVEKDYTGSIYHVETHRSCFAVTANHRMLVSPMRRSIANGFSQAYDPSRAEWQFVPMAEVAEGKRSHWHMRQTGAVREEDYDVPTVAELDGDTTLRLLGLYVAEGNVEKWSEVDGLPRAMRISQKAGGRVQGFIETYLTSVPFRRYEYERSEKEGWRPRAITEVVWLVHGREYAASMEQWCGSGSSVKQLPWWTVYLSQRQAWVLLEAMIAGDGHVQKEHQATVYYTSSRALADSIQAMCVNVGITCHIWGPTPAGRNGTPMYHVNIRRQEDEQPVIGLPRRLIQVEHVNHARVVCFTVPSETLVTRRNGKVALHGNTKDGAHLVRLLLKNEEILREGTYRPRLNDAQRMMVRAILTGEWTVEQVIAWADQRHAEVEAMTSNLLPGPALVRIEELTIDVLSSLYGLRS